MSEELPKNPYGELETRANQHESLDSFDRDIDKLRTRIGRLSKATETLDIATQRDVLLFEANEIFLLLEKLFFTLEHDQLRGNIIISQNQMSAIRERIKSTEQEQNQVLEQIDGVCNRLRIASECSRIADQISELAVAVCEIEKKLKKLP